MSQYTIRQILGVREKKLEATLSFFDFSKALDSKHRCKMEQILFAYGLPKETVTAIMMQYKNATVKSAHRMETQTAFC